MFWKELLKKEIEFSYKSTVNLINMVDKDQLDWKPASGKNWMTTGQLLKHIADACGMGMKGFVTGDWGMPEGMDVKDLKPDEILPPAEKLPSVQSIEEALKLLEKDKQTAVDILNQCDEERLQNEPAPAPWDRTSMILGHRLLQMVDHLKVHKSQLFYYLKLQGKPVNTSHLWGE